MKCNAKIVLEQAFGGLKIEAKGTGRGLRETVAAGLLHVLNITKEDDAPLDAELFSFFMWLAGSPLMEAYRSDGVVSVGYNKKTKVKEVQDNDEE